MGNRRGFNNNILVSDSSFKLGVNKPINLVSPTAASKTAPKEVPNEAPTVHTKLPHGERVLLQEHSDEMMAISVLLIATSAIFFYFFKK